MGQTGRGRPPASVEVRGKLQLWRVDDGRRGSARSARADDKGQIGIEFNPIYLVFCVIYHLFLTF